MDPDGGSSPPSPSRGTHRQELLREGATMALYVSLSLLAVMVALPREVTDSPSASTAGLLFVTSLGLLFAHQLAYRISARLAHQGQLLSEHLQLLGVQLVGGLAVTAAAVVPILAVEGHAGVLISELLLIGFIAVVAYVAARSVPLSRVRALGYVLGVVAVTLAILWLENLVDH